MVEVGMKAKLVSSLDAEPLFDYLIQNGVLNEETANDIRTIESNDKRNSQLVEHLDSHGNVAIGLFINALRLSGQLQLASSLDVNTRILPVSGTGYWQKPRVKGQVLIEVSLAAVQTYVPSSVNVKHRWISMEDIRSALTPGLPMRNKSYENMTIFENGQDIGNISSDDATKTGCCNCRRKRRSRPKGRTKLYSQNSVSLSQQNFSHMARKSCDDDKNGLLKEHCQQKDVLMNIIPNGNHGSYKGSEKFKDFGALPTKSVIGPKVSNGVSVKPASSDNNVSNDGYVKSSKSSMNHCRNNHKTKKEMLETRFSKSTPNTPSKTVIPTHDTCNGSVGQSYLTNRGSASLPATPCKSKIDAIEDKKEIAAVRNNGYKLIENLPEDTECYNSKSLNEQLVAESDSLRCSLVEKRELMYSESYLLDSNNCAEYSYLNHYSDGNVAGHIYNKDESISSPKEALISSTTADSVHQNYNTVLMRPMVVNKYSSESSINTSHNKRGCDFIKTHSYQSFDQQDVLPDPEFFLRDTASLICDSKLSTSEHDVNLKICENYDTNVNNINTTIDGKNGEVDGDFRKNARKSGSKEIISVGLVKNKYQPGGSIDRFNDVCISPNNLVYRDSIKKKCGSQSTIVTEPIEGILEWISTLDILNEKSKKYMSLFQNRLEEPYQKLEKFFEQRRGNLFLDLSITSGVLSIYVICTTGQQVQQLKADYFKEVLHEQLQDLLITERVLEVLDVSDALLEVNIHDDEFMLVEKQFDL